MTLEELIENLTVKYGNVTVIHDGLSNEITVTIPSANITLNVDKNGNIKDIVKSPKIICDICKHTFEVRE